MSNFRVGVIGCGRISDIYLQNCRKSYGLDVVACASLNDAESRAKAEQFQIPKACAPEEIFGDPEIDAVLNLTVPAAHYAITRKALDAGKHVYSEKPFVTDLHEGRVLLDIAANNGLKVGCAPDTFLGGRWQTVRKLVDQGAIGAPTGVAAFVPTHGTERHNPNPDFYYQKGGGPLLDLGPYYLSAMVFCLGAIKRVCGLSRRTFSARMIENGPRHGEMMPVDVDTHCLSLIEFESGAIGQMMISFDVWDSETPRFEIYGEEGTICIADPDPVHGANVFHGDVWIRTRDTARWTVQPRPQGRDSWQVADNTHGYNHDARGLGLLDMAWAVRNTRPVRASGELAYHVCEAMQGMLSAPQLGQFVDMQSGCGRPRPLPENFPASEA